MGSRFGGRDIALMKSLQNTFGKNIWKKCIVALTFSNEAQKRIQKMTGESEHDAIADYKQYLYRHVDKFQQQLTKLNDHNIMVRNVFGFDFASKDRNTIPAIPVGEECDDPVLPDIHSSRIKEIRRLNWKEVLIMKIVEIATLSGNHKEAYKQAIQEGVSVQIRAVRLNLVGLPRSGKTSFLRRMMEEILNIMAAIARGEKEQPSTGVAEAGGQVFIRSDTSRSVGTIASKKWSILRDLVKEAGMFGNILYQTVKDKPLKNPKLEADRPSVASSTERREKSSAGRSSARKQPSVWQSFLNFFNSFFTRTATRDSTATGDSTATIATESEIEEMVSVLYNSLSAEDLSDLLDDLIILINTDTGGQAEFLDLQASLVQGPSLNLLFSRLVDKLDSEFEVYYTNEKGKSTEKEGSIITTEEVLYQSLSSIAGCGDTFHDGDDTPSGEARGSTTDDKTPGQSKSKVMLVGTFRDKVSKEEFERKDRLLQEKIKATPFYEKNVIEFASEDQLMLAVDNMSGGEDEVAKIRSILEKVIVENFEKIKIPASWLVLSLQMRSKKLRTMTLQECEALAWKVRISPPELQHVLWFLHHHVGVLLYYPQLPALKDTVICDIQVVYDSATNLIKNTFTFDQVGQSVMEQFREKAQFSLKDVERAMLGYTDALIPLQKLIQLLKYLGVLTPIPSPSGHGSPPNPTYFMPCVLRSARACELSVNSCNNSDPVPLMLRYNCGYVPAGMFPSMIVNLVSQNLKGWKMLEKDLCKNRVQFHVGEDCDTVTLISRPRYLEFVISRSEGFLTPTASLCSQVQGDIQSTLSTVTSRMNHRFTTGYKFGFECPTHPGREHLCVLAHEKARRMQCLHDETETIPLQQKHKVWFSNEADTTVETAPDFSSYVWSLPASARPLLEQQLDWDSEGVDRDLNQIAHHMLDWEGQLCSHLGLTEVDVHDIKDSHSGKPELQRREALRRWKRKQGLRATYGNLLEVFVKAGNAQCSEIVCTVLRERPCSINILT